MRNRMNRSTQGFTMVELMVALVAGVMAVSASWALARGASESSRDQYNVAHMQMALRFAVDQLEQDIESTAVGMFDVTNTSTGTLGCAGTIRPADDVFAIEFDDDSDNAALPNATFNQVSADRLRLAMSATRNVYGGTGSGSTIVFDEDDQSFREDFGVKGATGDESEFSETDFENAFTYRDAATNYRFLSIEMSDGPIFLQISSISPGDETTPASITLAQALCTASSDLRVAPLTKYEYLVVNPRTYQGADGTNSLDYLNTRNTVARETALGQQGSILIRRELNLVTNAVINNSEDVVMVDVADFNLQFVVDTTPTLPTPTLLIAAPGTGENVRSILLTLSIRARESNRQFRHIARLAGEPLLRYQPAPAMNSASNPPAARVRTITTERFLQNM